MARLARMFCGAGLGTLVVLLCAAPSAAVAQEEIEQVRGLTMSTGQWRQRLEAWGKQAAGKGEQADAAAQRVRAVRDPQAVPALNALLARERALGMRLLWIAPLPDIGGPEALAILVRLSVEEPQQNRQLREAAAQGIGRMPNVRDALPQYARYLKSEKFATAAAEALKASGLSAPVATTELPDQTLTYALIEALVGTGTTSVRIYEWWYYHHAGSGLPGSGFGTRRHRGPRNVPVEIPVPNPIILETLVEYTGADYAYDQNAWKKWYEEKKRETGMR